jgi:hypothetical protein
MLRKIFGIIFSAFVLLSQTPLNPAFAGAASFTPSDTNPNYGTISGDASIKAIGSLHLSEGKVIMQQNQITVLSDAADSMGDAELQGAIIDAHTEKDGNVHGVAIFTRGYSLPALDDARAVESIKGTDGIQRAGIIVDATPKMLHIKTGLTVQAIPTRYIVSISSPRAFAFSLPISPATKTQLPSNEVTLVSFSPTYIPNPNSAPLLTAEKSLHGQITKRHPGKQTFNAAAITAGTAACFALPLGIAVACPSPRHFQNNGN